MTDRDIFKLLCYGQSVLIPQSLIPKISRIRPLIPVCRHCGQEIAEADFDINIGYWTPVWSPVHKGCAKEIKSTEAYECQKIDADCNDCKFFDRTNRGDCLMVMERALLSRMGGSNGYCSKHKKTVLANANNFSGFPCFIHRLDNSIKTDL